MTLAKGDHVVKLDKDGQPLTTEAEVYIEFEVVDLSPHFSLALHDPEAGGRHETFTVALLRKTR